MYEDDEPTSLTFETDQAAAAVLIRIGIERTHAAAVAEQILIANRLGNDGDVEVLASALREQMSGAWDEELVWSGPVVPPTYMVIGIYRANQGERYATSVETDGGPAAAEALAQRLCREDNRITDDEQPIEVAAVLRGVHEVVA